ncbi:alkaline ceramidase ydc1 [Mycoemilia scoparia]|uniref:Alkaline ceramidase ydc1 n=1 Tax=Mycoemilia scoparia TaxID=417184 RepID=A0A9W8DVK1_9FUNG|nr:alkaline ceramidase ydc1 [Mycoemilia scoparia]
MGMIILDSVSSENSYFWGKRTSTIDWCEENYAKSHYIAEFWNTVTNVVFTCHIGFGLVGIGSFCFHATLKYTTQLLDELPMLYVATLGSYALIEIRRDIRHGMKLPVILFLINLAVTLAYLWVVNPVFHQIVFASFVIFCFSRSYMLMGKVYDKEVKRQLIQLLSRSAIMFLTGFCVWNLDNILCHHLRSYRRHAQFPLDGILQLHGWWHVLTGYACHYAFTFITLLRITLWNENDKYMLEYSDLGVPRVVLRNGKAKPF